MKLFEQALNILQSGVMILDQDLKVIFINEWLDNTFIHPESLQDKFLLQVFPELRHQRIHRCIQQALKQGLPSVLSPGLNRAPLPLCHERNHLQDGKEKTVFAQMIRIQSMIQENQRCCMLEVQDVSTMMRREKLLNEQAEKLNQLALTDELTGIANRRHFNGLLEQTVKQSIQQQQAMSLIFFDIDFFKSFNDSLGHQAGDLCLSTITQQLKTELGSGNFHLARYGGEEFCIIMPGTEPEQARRMAENYRQHIEQLGIHHPASQVSDVVTASFGVAGFQAGSQDTFTGLILKADNALYRAKTSGRNQVVLLSQAQGRAQKKEPAENSDTLKRPKS